MTLGNLCKIYMPRDCWLPFTGDFLQSLVHVGSREGGYTVRILAYISHKSMGAIPRLAYISHKSMGAIPRLATGGRGK